MTITQVVYDAQVAQLRYRHLLGCFKVDQLKVVRHLC